MKKAFSLTALLALCGLGVGVLASCQEIPAIYGGQEVTHDHSWDEGVVTVEPTCTEEGEMTYTCSCGETKTESIEALGHDYTAIEYVVIDEAEENAGWYIVCSRCGEVSEALAEDADPLAGGAVSASTAAGLEAALDAVNDETREDGEEVVITLTGDVEASGLEISGSNVTLTGEGELKVSDSIEVSGSDVTLDGLTIDATGVDAEGETGGSAAVKVTGDSTTISDCTIVGGGANSTDASILVATTEEESDVTISGCDISGAYRGIYVNQGGSVNLEISGCEIHASYTINITGSSAHASSTLEVSDCGLYGWTSFVAVSEASFTNCTFGFSDSVGTDKVTGGFRPYSDVTLTGCHFCSLDSSGITLEEDQTNDTAAYLAIESNNYGISVGKDSVTIALISCTYDQSGENGSWTSETLSEENVINIMCDKSSNSCDFSANSASGFVFSLDSGATVWTLSELTSNNYGVPTGNGES